MPYYLAGPRTGVPHNNYPSFEEALSTLRRTYEIFCPAEILESGNEITAESAYRQLFDCDGVILLPGWAGSNGTKAEVLFATTIGKKIMGYYRHRPQNLEELIGINIITRAEMLK